MEEEGSFTNSTKISVINEDDFNLFVRVNKMKDQFFRCPVCGKSVLLRNKCSECEKKKNR